MMKKRMLGVIAVLLVCIFALSACKKEAGKPVDNAVSEDTTDDSEDTDQTDDAGKYKFGFSVIDMQNPYFITLEEAVQQVVDKVKISFKISKGDYDMSDTKETEGYTTVELTLDNDEVIECAILTVYEAAGKEYIALLPLDENLEPNEAGDVYLYQYNETEDGEPDLGNIEDDEEYEIAADAFDEWMDSQEFDESDIEE